MKLKPLLFLLCTIFSANAQNTGNISGNIIDKSTKTPIAYANILIKEIHSDKVITGELTDDNGNFKIHNLALKKYNLEIQYIGYKIHTEVIDLENEAKNIELKQIILEEEAIILNDVNIIAERSSIEQKIDRKVITVGKDLTTSGATASEIMNNIPSVNIDQDGKLSLRGNENVRVLVDGRPTNIGAAQLLKQIPSTAVKKIELITNPSAKYNPEGMSGIINIILHKNANNGFNGNFNSGITFGKEPKYNNSIDMNYRKGKVNFFGNYGSTFGRYFNEGHIKRLDNKSLQLLDILNNNTSYVYKIGMDFYINDKNTLSVYTNQNLYDGEGILKTNILYPPTGTIPNTFQYSKYLGNEKNGAYNLAYKHLFDKEGHSLDLEVNYNHYKELQNASFDTKKSDHSQVIYNDFIEDIRKNTTVNLDYIRPLNDKTNLELGAEARIIRSDNDYITTNISPGSANSIYNYDVDIYSFYSTFSQKFEKLSYQIGTRFESYKVKAKLNQQNIYQDDYITLYPSASLTYTLTEKRQLQLSYSRRVDRPDLSQTKPIREFSTPTLTSIGNPKLNPQFTNSVEFNYTKTFIKGSFTSGIYFRDINNEINRVIYPDPLNTNNQIMSFDNFDKNTAYGIELSLNYKINSWWDINPSIDFSNITKNGLISVKNESNTFDFVNTKIKAAAFNTRLNSNFKATKNLRFLLFGFYRGPVNGIQNNSKEMYKIDAGGRYTLMDGNLTGSLRFNDIFNTMRYAFDAENPYPQNGQFTWESHSIFFGLNYLFGGGKNKALQRKVRDDNTKQNSSGMF